MRRFSQRTSLVTLSEINITPLLDLAFVLLIIFIITTPLLEQSIEIKLPQGGQPSKTVNKTDIRTVEISMMGKYTLNRAEMDLSAIEAILIKDFHANSNLVVRIRADEMGRNKDTYALVDRLLANGITRFSLSTEQPTKGGKK